MTTMEQTGRSPRHQAIRQWQRGNAAAKMLYRLDDGMLADIGLARGDISKAVHIFHRRLWH